MKKKAKDHGLKSKIQSAGSSTELDIPVLVVDSVWIAGEVQVDVGFSPINREALILARYKLKKELNLENVHKITLWEGVRKLKVTLGDRR